MSTAQEPHVSIALKHLRHGVTGAGIAFAVLLIAYLFIWGFVHFTDVRSTRLHPNTFNAPLTVVEGSGSTEVGAAVAVDVNRVPGRGGILLERSAHVVQTLGIISVVGLTILMLQAVVIAGGGNVPGVEMAVTASSWTLVIAALALPWSALLSTFVFPGVFQSYDTLVASSEAFRLAGERANPLAYYSMHVLLPLLLLGGAAAAVIRFRMGVERGVIATHASQLDEKLEREIRARKLGELATPRAVGALNQAIGLPAPQRPEPELPVEPAPSGPQRPPMQNASPPAAAPAEDEPTPPKRPI